MFTELLSRLPERRVPSPGEMVADWRAFRPMGRLELRLFAGRGRPALGNPRTSLSHRHLPGTIRGLLYGWEQVCSPSACVIQNVAGLNPEPNRNYCGNN